jgi:hypothetical protein
MKTRPFNLEEALNGAKVVTRDGREVRQLTKFEGVTTESYSLVGVLGRYMCSWADDGRFNDVFGEEQSKDLFIAVEPRRAWVNVWRDVTDGGITIGKQHESREEAESRAKFDRYYIKTIEITDEL